MNREQKIWLGALVIIFACCVTCFRRFDEDTAVMSDETENFSATEALLTESDYRINATNDTIKLIFDQEDEKTWGEKVYYKDGKLVIQEGGSYLLKGRLDGMVVIDVYDDELVQLFLQNFEVYSSGEPALLVKSAGKVILTATEGSRNVFSDTEYRSDGEYNSCIYSEADLTFNGNGNVNIWGYYADAVSSKGKIKVVQGEYSVRTADDGIRGRDGVTIAGGIMEMQTEGCAIKSTNTESEKKGDITIQGGILTLIAGEHAVSAAKDLGVTGGTVATRTVKAPFVSNGALILNEECVGEIYGE